MTPGSAPALTAEPLPQKGSAPDACPTLSTLERMPKWLICVPLTLQWLWLALRYRSLTLPSAANPGITSGGLVGEGKLEYFDQMGPVARRWTAVSCGVVASEAVSHDHLSAMLGGHGLDFPLVAKPNLGLCGYGVRRVNDMAALLAYVHAFPRGETVVLQPYLPEEGEAGIFYARDPATGEGRVTDLALRYFPRVTGDGASTLAQLMAKDTRTRRLSRTARHEMVQDLNHVPALGEVHRLSTIGSTRVGGLYRDGAVHITPTLVRTVDAIARDMGAFHFGRFDVRFDRFADLQAGNMTIMEVNGAGSEAIQAWDPDVGVAQGFRMIFAKQALLFAIGHAQRARGVRPMGVWALARLNHRQNKLVQAYPPSN